MPHVKLLSIPHASRVTGISYKLLASAVKSGRIRTIRLSKRDLIPEEALKAFVAEANRPAAI